MISFLSPKLLLWIPLIVAALALVLRKDFVKFRSQKEQIIYRRSKKDIRLFLFLSRGIMISCLLIALAVPFTTKQTLIQGDPALTIFIDSSKSVDLFDRGVVEQVKQQVEREIPVTVRQICEANRSAIGDALLSYLQGNDNVLLVSDGNNNYGRSLGDMVTFAAMLNSTINALRISPVKRDAAVVVSGPAVTTAQAENTFYVDINKAGSVDMFNLRVTVDDELVLSKIVTAGSYEFKKKFSEGYHKIVASIDANDEFPENNIYYKAMKVEPKPKVAFVSKEDSPMNELLPKIYDVYSFTSLPLNLEPYSAVILNNIPAAELNKDALNDYVADGNGLFVIGGYNSFDMDNYNDKGYKQFEALLPVTVNKGKEKEKKEANVVLLIDKSGSTGQLFGAKSGNTIESVEKALAITILDDLRDDDQVAVVAFDAAPYVVSEFSRLGSKKSELKEKVSSIVYGGGTIIYEGINKADELMSQVRGSKNVILISDGRSGASYWDDIVSAKRVALHGGKLYTVGVGEETNYQLMQDLAEKGGGVYFEPQETQRIKVIFGRIDSQKQTYKLETLNNYHFITRSITLDATVTGLNTVVPKSSAMMLVTTESNDPVLTVWRFGLGRVAALSTDDGSRWSAPLLMEKNSLLLTRTINWAVGDLSRKKEFDVSASDVSLGEVMEINVKSKDLPSLEGLQFSKVGENIYSAAYTPQKAGFYSFFNADVAANVENELQMVGINPELESLIGLSGGKIFEPSQTDDIIKKVREDSKRYKTEIVSYSWLPMLLALLLLLLDISVRRLTENKKYK